MPSPPETTPAPPAQPDADRRAARRFLLGASAGVLTLTALLFNRIVFLGEWLSSRDIIRVYYPLAHYWAERVRHGEFPEWYPYNALGQPFVGMTISAAFHPLRLLFLFLPLDAALSVESLLCYPAAALGAFLCARRLHANPAGALFAGLTYAFCGYMVGVSNNLDYLMAAATFPFVLWAFDRLLHQPSVGRFAAASALLCLLVFTGDSQTVVVVGGAVLLIALITPASLSLPRRVGLAVLAVGVGMLLAAPQLLPSIRTLGTARENINPLYVAEKFSLHPIRLLEFPLGPVFMAPNVGLIPMDMTFLNDPSMNSDWVDSVAVGLVAFVLACGGIFIRARRAVRFTMLGALAFVALLMVGRFTPVYGWAYAAIPFWKNFRYPEKLVPLFSFLLALSAAVALSRALQADTVRRRLSIALLAAGVGAAVGAALIFQFDLWASFLRSWNVAPRSAGPMGTAFGHLLLASAAFSLVAGAALWRLRASLSGVALCALQGAFLVWLHLPLPQTVGVPLLTEPAGFVENLRELGADKPGGPRVYCRARHHLLPPLKGYDPRELLAIGVFITLSPDTAALFDMETSAYYMPAASTRMALGVTQGELFPRKLAPLYGTRYFTVDGVSQDNFASLPGHRVVGQLGDWGVSLVEDTLALPRAYLAHPWCVEDKYGALDLLYRPESDFKAGVHALIECGEGHAGDPAPREEGELGKVSVVAHHPEHVELAVDAVGDGVVVLNDAYYEGWQAKLDGAPAPILGTNVAVRGVRVGPGHHTLTFDYRQPGLRLGLLLALLAALGLVCAKLVLGRRGAAHPLTKSVTSN